MRLIAHRGNVSGPSPRENSLDHICAALERGYDVEIDLWYDRLSEQMYLGHDEPVHRLRSFVEFGTLNFNKIWIHCKNFEALDFLVRIDSSLNYFFHDKDDFTLTSKGFIWTYPNKQVGRKSVIVVQKDGVEVPDECYGICSDFVSHYKN